MASYSQAIQLLSLQNAVISNGDTMYVSGSVNDAELVAAVLVKNISSVNAEVKCRKWIISSVPGSSNVFCWANLCYPPNTTESNPKIIAPDVVVNDFSGHYYPNQNPGKTIIMYTFDVRGGDSAWIYVKYDATEQGINSTTSAKFGKLYPNPANKEVFIPYNLLNQSTGVIEIYDITGKKQLSQEIRNHSNLVQLPVSGLKEGIYFIQLVSANKILDTEKLVIKR